jgi:hypothetical protein
MGERAKKKRVAESRARKTTGKKAAEQVKEIPASTGTDSTSRSNAGNSKKTRAAPRVPSSASTRHSTRLLSSSSKLETGKHTSASAKGNDESAATRPQRSATAAANALLQQLQISETESVDSEEDLDGESIILIWLWHTDFKYNPDGDVELVEGSDKGSGDDQDSSPSGDSDNEDSGDGSDSDIELIEGKVKPVALATRKGLPKVAASDGAQRKRKLQVIEEESSDDESGESIYCIRFLC